MEKRIVLFFTLLLLQGIYVKIFSQLKISGPGCIIPGTVYQYNLGSTFTKDYDINLCVEGGYIAADKQTCYTGSALDAVRIIWNEDVIKGKISVTTPSGKVLLAVRPTLPLQGGNIDSSFALRAVQPSAIPQMINCTVARGGSCSPSYNYQWEQSDDNLHWSEVESANDRNLSFSKSPERTTFFRRRVFEPASNSIAYSNIAIVVVTTQPAAN